MGRLQHANVASSEGMITLLERQGFDDLTFQIYMANDLWFHDRKSSSKDFLITQLHMSFGIKEWFTLASNRRQYWV